MINLGTIVVVGSVAVALILFFALSKYGPGRSFSAAGIAMFLPQVPRLLLPQLDKLLGYPANDGMARNWSEEIASAPDWVTLAMWWMIWVGVALILVSIPAGMAYRRKNSKTHNRLS